MVQTVEVQLIRRLRWTALLLIATNALITLAAQSSGFWHAPNEAIRFDGLAVHSATNPMFDFLLGYGWPFYIAGVAMYGIGVWVLVSILPTRLALAALFTIILGLCFSGTNWIAVRWHLGTGGGVMYLAPVMIALAIVVAPIADDANRRGLRYLCGLAALTTTVDGVLTLIGQPAGYWQSTAIVHEANPVSKFFLELGPWAYAAYIVAQIAVPWYVAMRAQMVTGWTIAFAVAVGGFLGASSWLFYEWRLGLLAPLLYAMLLSGVMAWGFIPRIRSVDEASQGEIPRKPALGCC